MKKRKYEYYEGLVRFCEDVLASPEKAISVLNKALADFPNDPKFQRALINLSGKIGDDEKLLQHAKAELQADPRDPINYFNLAIAYQRLKRLDEAIFNYKKCIELDNSNFDAHFNLGGIYYNQGVKVLQNIKESKEITFTDYQKDGEALEKDANDFFIKALPHFEVCAALDPLNRKVLIPLEFIYRRLKMEEKARRVTNLLNQ
ncbi:MAG: tetratricopeptide repeat protein [Bacteroidia bacterium]|nr:tetratricopeptide repeat protein [Bacteroidia bacterium]